MANKWTRKQSRIKNKTSANFSRKSECVNGKLFKRWRLYCRLKTMFGAAAEEMEDEHDVVEEEEDWLSIEEEIEDDNQLSE